MGVPNLLDLARFYKCDVYSYDYSGYGISSGHPSESNQKADIRAIYDWRGPLFRSFDAISLYRASGVGGRRHVSDRHAV
ncbi:hypothetical protein Y032_0235g3183 [Ancylostoma ceylanicum]|uniref:Serine aminopeptidase S33 domain-containing protein n=1 Tax=Ancylostoma ceylanicum TaxID=53326 RepID=A0A016SFT2_9BILA|nr:hypothetical protein Y032_0235g3183 [Ancylostoma ceylanicum]